MREGKVHHLSSLSDEKENSHSGHCASIVKGHNTFLKMWSYFTYWMKPKCIESSEPVSSEKARINKMKYLQRDVVRLTIDCQLYVYSSSQSRDGNIHHWIKRPKAVKQKFENMVKTHFKCPTSECIICTRNCQMWQCSDLITFLIRSRGKVSSFLINSKVLTMYTLMPIASVWLKWIYILSAHVRHTWS